jgi:DNA polymerase-3 subunit delta
VPRPPAPATHDVHLLAGDDDAARSERLAALIAERLDEAGRAFDLDRLGARDVDASALATLLETPPLAGAARVVVLLDVEAAPAAVERAVEAFLENPSPTTRLIAVASRKPTGAPWTSFRRVGREETFDPPRGAAALEARVRREVERHGRTIDPRAARLLAELLPDDTAAIGPEVEKLVALAGDRPRIEPQDVERVAAGTPAGDRWAFVDLVGMGRRDEALAALRRLLDAGESPIFLVTLLAQHFLLLGGIRACEARGLRASEEIGREVGKSAWALDRRSFRIRGAESARTQARRHDRAAVDRWLGGLLELDLALKSSRLPAAAVMEERLVRLLSPSPSTPVPAGAA